MSKMNSQLLQRNIKFLRACKCKMHDATFKSQNCRCFQKKLQKSINKWPLDNGKLSIRDHWLCCGRPLTMCYPCQRPRGAQICDFWGISISRNCQHQQHQKSLRIYPKTWFTNWKKGQSQMRIYLCCASQLGNITVPLFYWKARICKTFIKTHANYLRQTTSSIASPWGWYNYYYLQE